MFDDSPACPAAHHLMCRPACQHRIRPVETTHGHRLVFPAVDPQPWNLPECAEQNFVHRHVQRSGFRNRIVDQFQSLERQRSSLAHLRTVGVASAISSTILAAAAAGSTCAVIGRPITK